jgi:predicted deacylase
MQRVDELFPGDYADGRRRFAELVAEAGFTLATYLHPTLRGPSGEELACDVACLGPDSPRNLLLVSSGTHGVEGFCGSGAQAALLTEGILRELPQDTAIVLVHAVNPYGFAHLRRTNEGNVDLNRNFVDHGRNHPSPAYDEIHDWLVPADWDGPARQRADAELQRYQETRGMRAFQSAVTGGQYSHPDGLFYGGRGPAWSNVTWRRILREHCSRAGHVIAIDLHTGLGPWGVGEAIAVTDEAEYRRALEFFGDDVKWTGSGGSVSAQIGGSLVHGAHEELGPGRLTMIGLEYGTYPIPETLDALRAETWLVARGDVNSVQGRQIKERLRDVFYVNDPAWKRAVVERLFEFVGRLRSRLA